MYSMKVDYSGYHCVGLMKNTTGHIDPLIYVVEKVHDYSVLLWNETFKER